METTLLADILRLRVTERLRLVGEIWDSIAATPEELPLTDAQREDLARRVESYRQNPGGGSPWPEVKKRLTRR